MVYFPTFTIKLTIHVGKYTILIEYLVILADFFSGKAPLRWAIDPTKHVVPGILPSMDFLKAMIPGGSTGARWVRAIPRQRQL